MCIKYDTEVIMPFNFCFAPLFINLPWVSHDYSQSMKEKCSTIVKAFVQDLVELTMQQNLTQHSRGKYLYDLFLVNLLCCHVIVQWTTGSQPNIYQPANKQTKQQRGIQKLHWASLSLVKCTIMAVFSYISFCCLPSCIWTRNRPSNSEWF